MEKYIPSKGRLRESSCYYVNINQIDWKVKALVVVTEFLHVAKRSNLPRNDDSESTWD